MADPVGVVDSALWRIAELGARCGQRSAGVDRRPMWEELERLIVQLGEELTAARQGGPTATPEVHRLQRQLKVLVGERDAERARAAEHVADAEAARRERDRARQEAAAPAASWDRPPANWLHPDVDTESATEPPARPDRAEGPVDDRLVDGRDPAVVAGGLRNGAGPPRRSPKMPRRSPVSG